MSAAVNLLWGIAVAVQAPAIFLYLFMPLRRSWKGRHVSKPLIRRLGMGRTRALRYSLFPIVGVALAFPVNDPRSIPSALAEIVFALWLIDDALFGGDDEDKSRRRDWAKAKLRKLKPVRLRPAERWAPAPA